MALWHDDLPKKQSFCGPQKRSFKCFCGDLSNWIRIMSRRSETLRELYAGHACVLCEILMWLGWWQIVAWKLNWNLMSLNWRQMEANG